MARGISGETPDQGMNAGMNIEAFLMLAQDPDKWAAMHAEFKAAKADADATVKAAETYAYDVRLKADQAAHEVKNRVRAEVAVLDTTSRDMAERIVAKAKTDAAAIRADAEAVSAAVEATGKRLVEEAQAAWAAAKNAEASATMRVQAASRAQERLDAMTAEADAAMASAEQVERAFNERWAAILKAAGLAAVATP